MFDIQRWPKRAGRMNTKTRRTKKGCGEKKRKMIRILAKDAEHQLGTLTLKRGEITQMKHTKVC